MITKKITKWLFAGIVIFALGGIGGVFFDKYLIPILGKCKFFENYDIFQKMEKNTTIINKTETIVVRDDNLINEISSNASSSIVKIFSFTNEIKLQNKFAKKSKKESAGKKGSGVILTNDGVIVTYRSNIIEDKDAIYKVAIFDGSIFEAKLLGVDNFTNLAYLHVEGINLPAIPFANSDDVNLGKKVIVMGSSLGGEQSSLTEGILSDFDAGFNLAGQTVSSSEKLEGVFKISFAENERYVGGPVIDYNGEMLAITGVLKKDNQNVYFQIPVNVVKNSMNKISDNGFQQGAGLGIYYLSLNPFYRQLYDLPVDKGALIYSSSGEQGLAIITGSPAEKSGLKINDIILSVDGKEVDLKHPLSDYIDNYKKGDTVKFKILRNEKEMEIGVVFTK